MEGDDDDDDDDDDDGVDDNDDYDSILMICSAFELHGGGSGYVDYKQLEVDPSHKLSIEIGMVRLVMLPHSSSKLCFNIKIIIFITISNHTLQSIQKSMLATNN